MRGRRRERERLHIAVCAVCHQTVVATVKEGSTRQYVLSVKYREQRLTILLLLTLHSSTLSSLIPRNTTTENRVT